MPAQPRSDVFDPDTVGIYHCYNQLVQQRHLFGRDYLTGKDYSYRKHWVRDRFRALAGCMAIDVLDYAILGNHIHIVLRNRPDIVESWSDEEVVRRWWYVCPERKKPDGTAADPKPCELNSMLDKVQEFRSRLSDISWMMRLVCQPISRRANAEDHKRGRFFASRFECNRLKDLADILACSLYIDLNLVRAGIVDTPEESEFTSAFDRIQTRWQKTQNELRQSETPAAEEGADAWLAPIFLDERAQAYGQTPKETEESQQGSAVCNPIGAPRISNKGFLPLPSEQYLSTLDACGRTKCLGKSGVIPSDLEPILQRLNIQPERWLAAFSKMLSQRARAPGVMT